MTHEGASTEFVRPRTQHKSMIHLAEPDPTWPEQYAEQAAMIREALGERVLLLAHSYRAVGDRCVGTTGAARWHAPAPKGEFTYLELVVDSIDCDGALSGSGPVSPSAPQPAH